MGDDRFLIVTGPVREGAVPVHVYNEGLVYFVYDEAHFERIREADAEIVEFIGEGTFDDPATRSLIEEGILLVVGLHGDGGVDLEILVGEPLREAELAGGRWSETQRGLLKLPSGRAQVHSYNTLPLGDNEGEDLEDEGAVVQVPPGDYVVTLYRKDWETMEAEGVMSLEEAQEAGIECFDESRIDEVLVLTPVADAAPLGAPPGVLFRACVDLGWDADADNDD